MGTARFCLPGVPAGEGGPRIESGRVSTMLVLPIERMEDHEGALVEATTDPAGDSGFSDCTTRRAELMTSHDLHG